MKRRAKRTDVLSPTQRSWCMSQIKGRDTKPELWLRKALWAAGFRYRLGRDVEGKPDLVFKGAHVAVFIDGCFWHSCPLHGVMPKGNSEFWRKKLVRNVVRDRTVTDLLTREGWRVLRFWEHEVERELPRVVWAVAQVLTSND